MLLKPPLLPAITKALRLPERKLKSMTIAIGMLCGNGAIVAADRRRAHEDGSTTTERKIFAFDGANITFAIADASHDANAAQTLVRKVSSRLGTAAVQGWGDVEPLIADAMTEWYAPFTQAPTTHLIISVLLKGFGVQLYFCEPPNTVLPKPEGYVAAGIGSSVADPLTHLLFGASPMQSRHPQNVLRQIAYLMYRAKKDNIWCGGSTDAVYLDSRRETWRWVNHADMKQAEEASFQLDLVLNSAASATLGYLRCYLSHRYRSATPKRNQRFRNGTWPNSEALKPCSWTAIANRQINFAKRWNRGHA